ncbi:MerR family transcriptional regulator [Streptomyces sp. JNUCC 64]
MRIGELSRRTGVPVPTIKYYVREGLLPPGELTQRNQATYGEPHEHRLRLIRALLDVGGLRIAAIRDVLGAVDDSGRSVHSVLGAASDVLVGRDRQSLKGEVEEDEALRTARARVAGLIARRGWLVNEGCPGVEALAAALAAVQRVGLDDFATVLDDYAGAAEAVARADLDFVGARRTLDEVVEGVIVGTVLGDTMFSALRHLAQVDRSARQYGKGKGAPSEGARADRPGGATEAGTGEGAEV